MKDLSAGEMHRAIVNSFDEATNSLSMRLINAPIDINVSAFADSIAIAGADNLKTTTTLIGAKRGLDVNVIDLVLDAIADSIAVSDGTNKLKVNADGSINIVVTSSASKGFSSVNFSGQILVGTTSTVLLAANAARKYVSISNNSQYSIYLQFRDPAALSRGIKVSPGAVFTMSGYELYLGQINAMSATLNVPIDTLEGT